MQSRVEAMTHLARITRSECVVAPKGSPTTRKPMLVLSASSSTLSTPCKLRGAASAGGNAPVAGWRGRRWERRRRR